VRDATLADGNNLCGAASGSCNLKSSDAKLVQQSLNSSRMVPAPASVNWSTQNGWSIDLNQSSGERVYLDGEPLSAGVLAFASAVPGGSVCAPSGISYLYLLSLNKGTVLTVTRYNTLIVGLGRNLASNGDVNAMATLRTQGLPTVPSPPDSLSAGSSVRRATWRELIN